MKWTNVQLIFEEYMILLGNPNCILVTPSEYTKRTGCHLGGYDGMCHEIYDRKEKRTKGGLITLKRNRPKPEIRENIVHEIAHILFPKKPHWWIEVFAHKVTRTNGTGRYTKRYDHGNRDLPPRNILIEMAQKSAGMKR